MAHHQAVIGGNFKVAVSRERCTLNDHRESAVILESVSDEPEIVEEFT